MEDSLPHVALLEEALSAAVNACLASGDSGEDPFVFIANELMQHAPPSARVPRMPREANVPSSANAEAALKERELAVLSDEAAVRERERTAEQQSAFQLTEQAALEAREAALVAEQAAIAKRETKKAGREAALEASRLKLRARREARESAGSTAAEAFSPPSAEPEQADEPEQANEPSPRLMLVPPDVGVAEQLEERAAQRAAEKRARKAAKAAAKRGR